jgi:hypothetical protein
MEAGETNVRRPLAEETRESIPAVRPVPTKETGRTSPIRKTADLPERITGLREKTGPIRKTPGLPGKTSLIRKTADLPGKTTGLPEKTDPIRKTADLPGKTGLIRKTADLPGKTGLIRKKADLPGNDLSRRIAALQTAGEKSLLRPIHETEKSQRMIRKPAKNAFQKIALLRKKGIQTVLKKLRTGQNLAESQRPEKTLQTIASA